MFVLPQSQFAIWQTITISVSEVLSETITYDTYFRYTSLLINADNVSTGLQNITFIDSSTNNYTISTVGSPTQTAFTPFYPNGWSGYFSGAGRLVYTLNADLSFGTNPYTIEAWIYPKANSSFIYTQAKATINYLLFIIDSSNRLNMRSSALDAGSDLPALSSYIQLNRWTHVTLVRETTGTNGIKFYQDGVLVGVVSNSVDLSDTTNMVPAIGGYQHTTGSEFNGYISNLRVTKNQALYTGPFTPSVSPLTNYSVGATGPGAAPSLTGTVGLLALQDNNFKDNSLSAKTASLVGTTPPQIIPTTPFSTYTNASYSTYFNPLITNKITVSNSAANSDFYLGSSDWTMECWVNIKGYTTNTIATKYRSGVANIANSQFQFYANSATIIGLSLCSGAAQTTISFTDYSRPLNTWYHIAVVRNNNILTCYVNGTQYGATSAYSSALNNGTYDFNIGNRDDTDLFFNGYMSNFRLVKGQALYTSNFTPATAALTNNSIGATGAGVAASITGTVSLLTLQDNTFKDNSTTPKAITTSGTPVITRNTPFFNSYGLNVPSTHDGSVYFDGASRVSAPAGSDFAYGLSAFTVEAWVYPTSFTSIVGGDPIIYSQTVININYFLFGINASGQLFFISSTTGGGTAVVATSGSLILNQWSHVTLVREGSATNQLKFYINGNLTGVGTTSANFTDTGRNPSIGAYTNTLGVGTFSGYISNLRVIKGQALYTGNFTPSIYALTNNSIGATGAGVAASLTGTVSLLTLQDNLFIDNSTTPKAITISGTPIINKYNTPFLNTYNNTKNYGGYFNGTSYLSMTTSSDFNFGSGDFTIEAWIYTADTQFQIVAGTVQNQLGFGYNIDNSSQGLWLGRVGTAPDAVSNTQLTYNTWNHVAVTKSSNSVRFFVNGIQVGSTTTSNFTYTQGGLYVGRDYGVISALYYTGYISNLRVIKGQALYTGNFTPSISALTNNSIGATGAGVAASLTGTVSLLTLQDNTFKDNSTTPKAITTSGTPVITEHTPFFNGAGFDIIKYTPSLYDGSVYFDGSSNLRIENGGQFDMNTSFTVEAWFYQLTTSASTGAGMGVGGGVGGWNATNGNEWVLSPNYNGALNFQYFNGSTVTTLTTTGSKLKQWNHIAVGYSGTTVSVWLNGTRVINNASVTVSLPTTRNIFRIGNAASSDAAFPGYISDLRVVRGTDVYGVSNTSITVPTGPLSAISNTSLLLRGNNGAIIDATGKNTITVASSTQVDTTIRKFAPGSIKFNGTSDYIKIDENNSVILSSGGPFTIEGWLYPTTFDTSNRALFSKRSSATVSTVSYSIALLKTSGYLEFHNGTTGYASTTALTLSTWNHVAITYDGSNLSMYKNGTRIYGPTAVSITNQANPLYIGTTTYPAAESFAGYMDDIRITKGIVRYSGSSFTIPVSAHPTK